MKGETHFFKIEISFVRSVIAAPGNIFLIAKSLLVFLWRAFQTSPNWLENKKRPKADVVSFRQFSPVYPNIPANGYMNHVDSQALNLLGISNSAYPLPMRSTSSNSADGSITAVAAIVPLIRLPRLRNEILRKVYDRPYGGVKLSPVEGVMNPKIKLCPQNSAFYSSRGLFSWKCHSNDLLACTSLTQFQD